jgi:hypothetical protein
MSVDEMKKKVHELVDKQVDEKKLQKTIALLTADTYREVSVEEVFAEMSSRYDETLRRLAQ